MHSVHDIAVEAQQDWIGQIRLKDQPCVFDDLADRRQFGVCVEPARSVDVSNGGERNILNWQSITQLDEPIYVECVKATTSKGSDG